jgi:hypothetical protein
MLEEVRECLTNELSLSFAFFEEAYTFAQTSVWSHSSRSSRATYFAIVVCPFIRVGGVIAGAIIGSGSAVSYPSLTELRWSKCKDHNNLNSFPKHFQWTLDHLFTPTRHRFQYAKLMSSPTAIFLLIARERGRARMRLNVAARVLLYQEPLHSCVRA